MVTASGLKAMPSADITMADIAAVILVGGKSSRMGTDKSQLCIGGIRLIDIVASAISAAGIADIYVSGNCDGFKSIPDETPHLGPVGGICSSIKYLRDNYRSVIFIPVDMPLLKADLLKCLMHSNNAHYSDNPLPCIISLNDNLQLYSADIFSALNRGEKISVKSFMAGINTTIIPTTEQLTAALTNTNTPEEWRKATNEFAHQ